MVRCSSLDVMLELIQDEFGDCIQLLQIYVLSLRIGSFLQFLDLLFDFRVTFGVFLYVVLNYFFQFHPAPVCSVR